MPSQSFALRTRLVAFLSLFYLTALMLTPIGPVRAQDEEAADAAPADNAPPPAGEVETTEVERPSASMLTYLLRAHSDPFAAFIGLGLLGLSMYFVALVIRLMLEFRMSEAVPPELIDKLEASIKERRFQDAYDACRDNPSFLARLLRAGIANLPNGRAEAKEAMTTLAEEIVVTMETRITYLATIGTLGPMIGLVGTIWGMIRSFQEIALAAGTQPRADQVAGGISTALFITLEGVSISVPAIFFYAFFRNRIALISMEATKIANRTIAAFWTAARQPGQPARPRRSDPS